MLVFNTYIPSVIISVFLVIYTVLSLSTVVFFLLNLKKPTPLLKELILRTKSWWFIVFGITLTVVCPLIVGTLIIAYVSFVALREMLSIGRLRDSDRTALFVAYLAIPVQYFLAYNNYSTAFYCFIPIVMFMAIPTVLVLTGKTTMIGRSMSIIPTLVILTVYFLSHIIPLFHFDTQHNSAGHGGLLLFLFILTGFNDVFQYIWGKLIGKHSILPKVSPNKTWEGFVGGVLSTAALSYALQFLLPISGYKTFILGLTIGIAGFLGDAILSAVKRDLTLKDTDNLIPGHGGAMDRLDSLVLTAPVFYHLLTFLNL